ncbi:glutathione S-transferase family protein [Brevundimonas sp.]|uniref:glutathione S-transferase family protein n=1 Tax=Brevundimonas sp. TaxID=1871086 RepID=UPI003D0B6382
MAEITLFAAPGSCSRVATIVLEEIGVPFTYELVRFMKGFHKSPAYKAVNPKGKVPALIVDGEALTENVAILSYLAATYPDGRVLPAASTPMAAARIIADLCFCSATLHPLVTRYCMSVKIGGEEGAAAVKAVGAEAMKENAALIDQRLCEGDWWYGDAWSAMDAYLYWVFGRFNGAGYDLSPYPRWQTHAARMEARPAVQRALAHDEAAQATLSAERMQMGPGGAPKAA